MVYWVAAVLICFLEKKKGLGEDRAQTLNIQMTRFYVIIKMTAGKKYNHMAP